MELHHVRMGSGPPLLLIHGLGSGWRSWEPVLRPLTASREVIAVDLPGFGETPPLPEPASVSALADAVASFLEQEGLEGVDVAGNSIGARLALELARRGTVGATVALSPAGFWQGWERLYFGATIAATVRLMRLLQPLMPALTRSEVGRTLLFAQFSARPWRLMAELMLREMRGFATSPGFQGILGALLSGPTPPGIPAGRAPGPIMIGWGRQDRVCLPRQAKRALARFPGARLHWFRHSGHFPQWDVPNEAANLILRHTGDRAHRPAPGHGATLHPRFANTAPAAR